MLLDGRLDRERRIRRDRLEVRRLARVPGARHRNAQLLRQPIGVPLVPRPSDGLPGRRRHAKVLREAIPMAREGSHRLLARRIEHPAIESQPLTDLEDGVDRGILVAQVANPNGVRRVARIPRDGTLVVDDAHRDAAASEAADDPQALVVAANDNGPHPTLPRKRGREMFSKGGNLFLEPPTLTLPHKGGGRKSSHAAGARLAYSAIWREATAAPGTNPQIGP